MSQGEPAAAPEAGDGIGSPAERLLVEIRDLLKDLCLLASGGLRARRAPGASSRAAGAPTKQCERAGCGNRFPAVGKRRFCSPSCKAAHWRSPAGQKEYRKNTLGQLGKRDAQGSAHTHVIEHEGV